MVPISQKYWKAKTRLLFNPILNPLIKHKVSPHFITLVGLAANILSLYFLFKVHLLFVFFSLINIILDNVDGALARALKKDSKFGNLLDKTADNLAGLLLYLRIYQVQGDSLAVVGAILFIGHMLLAGKGWYTIFGPHITLVRVFSMLGLYQIGLLTQVIYYPVALIGTKLYFYKNKE